MSCTSCPAEGPGPSPAPAAAAPGSGTGKVSSADASRAAGRRRAALSGRALPAPGPPASSAASPAPHPPPSASSAGADPLSLPAPPSPGSAPPRRLRLCPARPGPGWAAGTEAGAARGSGEARAATVARGTKADAAVCFTCGDGDKLKQSVEIPTGGGGDRSDGNPIDSVGLRYKETCSHRLSSDTLRVSDIMRSDGLGTAIEWTRMDCAHAEATGNCSGRKCGGLRQSRISTGSGPGGLGGRLPRGRPSKHTLGEPRTHGKRHAALGDPRDTAARTSMAGVERPEAVYDSDGLHRYTHIDSRTSIDGVKRPARCHSRMRCMLHGPCTCRDT